MAQIKRFMRINSVELFKKIEKHYPDLNDYDFDYFTDDNGYFETMTLSCVEENPHGEYEVVLNNEDLQNILGLKNCIIGEIEEVDKRKELLPEKDWGEKPHWFFSLMNTLFLDRDPDEYKTFTLYEYKITYFEFKEGQKPNLKKKNKKLKQNKSENTQTHKKAEEDTFSSPINVDGSINIDGNPMTPW